MNTIDRLFGGCRHVMQLFLKQWFLGKKIITGWCECKLPFALYSGSFLLVDVTVMPDKDIVKQPNLGALLLLQKYVWKGDNLPIDLFGATLNSLPSKQRNVVKCGDSNQ